MIIFSLFLTMKFDPVLEQSFGTNCLWEWKYHCVHLSYEPLCYKRLFSWICVELSSFVLLSLYVLWQMVTFQQWTSGTAVMMYGYMNKNCMLADFQFCSVINFLMFSLQILYCLFTAYCTQRLSGQDYEFQITMYRKLYMLILELMLHQSIGEKIYIWFLKLNFWK